MFEKIKQRLNKNLILVILIPCVIIMITLIIHYQSVAREKAKLDEGVQILNALETRDLYTMEEKIDFMKRKAVDSGDYSTRNQAINWTFWKMRICKCRKPSEKAINPIHRKFCQKINTLKDKK